MKNLALTFCSIRPQQLSENICDYREKEYLMTLQQLERVLPESFDWVICENTIDSEDQIKNKNLREYLSDKEMIALGREYNIGTKNKGLGELLMLKTALEETDLDNYNNISYISARRFFTCPYVFEKTERLEKQALLSNPDYTFLNGNFAKTHKQGLYNDMFFSMNSPIMLNYANYAINYIENDSSRSLGSEQLLYNFVTENKVEYEWLNWLGIVRNDWERNHEILDVNNFHIC